MNLLALILSACLLTGAVADEHNHIVSKHLFLFLLRCTFDGNVPPKTSLHICGSFQYGDNEEVVLWMNTVGPYHNRQETYAYFSLPFCVGSKESISHYHETLSEALQGVELEFSGIDIEFKSKCVECKLLSKYSKICLGFIDLCINFRFFVSLSLRFCLKSNLPGVRNMFV